MPASSRSLPVMQREDTSDLAVVGLVDGPADGGDALHQPSDPFLRGRDRSSPGRWPGPRPDRARRARAARTCPRPSAGSEMRPRGGERVARDQRQPRACRGRSWSGSRDVPCVRRPRSEPPRRRAARRGRRPGGGRPHPSYRAPSTAPGGQRAELSSFVSPSAAAGRRPGPDGPAGGGGDRARPRPHARRRARLVQVTQILAHPRSSIAGAGRECPARSLRVEAVPQGREAADEQTRDVHLGQPSRAPIWVWVRSPERW